MTHKELQDLERRDIGGQVAALEHAIAGVDRYTTLPTSEMRKDLDVLKVEGKLAENLDAVQPLLLGSLRAARLLEKTGAAEDLRKAFEAVTNIQVELARERGEE